VYSRILDINGKKSTLEFGHEGVLYKKNFIIYDKRTDSKWDHPTDLAMAGSLADKVLTILLSGMVRWKTWKEIFPKTKVLAREGYGGSMGTYGADRYSSELGLSVGQGPIVKLYPLNVLMTKKVVNDKVIIVVMDPASKQAVAFSSKVSDRILTFKPHKAGSQGIPLMRDQETGSLWIRMSGRTIEGPLKGSEILSMISAPWLKDRWRQIHETGAVRMN